LQPPFILQTEASGLISNLIKQFQEFSENLLSLYSTVRYQSEHYGNWLSHFEKYSIPLPLLTIPHPLFLAVAYKDNLIKQYYTKLLITQQFLQLNGDTFYQGSRDICG